MAANFLATLQRFDSALWGHHIVVPDEISQLFLAEGQTRVVCTLAGQQTFQCALMPRGEKLESAPVGKYFININKELRDKLHLKPGSEIQVDLRHDDSTYGLPMPVELAELLAQDPVGDQFFHALTPGKQRNLLYIAGKPKSTGIRLKKSLTILEHLKVNQGKLDFKRLNDDFKNGDW